MEWTTDADGNSVPRMAFGREGHERYLQQGGERVTKEAVRDVSQHLMRSLHTLLSGLPPLLKATWLSTASPRGRHPDDYEPEGFVPAATTSRAFSFCSQPVELAVGRGRHGPPGLELLYSADPQLVDDGQTTVGEQHAGGCGPSSSTASATSSRRPPAASPRRRRRRRRRACVGVGAGDATPSRSYPPSDAASVAKFTPARSSAAPPRRRRRRATPSVRSPLAPLSRGIQKKRASQASELIHTVFQEKAQQKRLTRAAGRR